MAPVGSVGTPVRVHMTGSEWFRSFPGGLNRYFSDLYLALERSDRVTVTASAFGIPEAGHHAYSWGDGTGGTLKRVVESLRDPVALQSGDIVDRHFCLYGRPRFGTHGRNPYVVHFHGPWAQESAVAGERPEVVRVKQAVERFRYRGADRAIVLSNHFRELLVDQYSVDPDRVVVIPPGVDLERFTPATGTGDGTVLCVRRLERRMGIDVLLHAWSEVVHVQPHSRLVVVGTGSEEDTLKTLASALGIDDSVTFAGRVDDAELNALYQRVSATVVPTLALEGFGLIALESLASGRAPIVTDCGGLPDAVRDLDSSLIVGAGDRDGLAKRLISALDGRIPDPAQCRRHAERFSWSAAAEHHADVYTEIAR